MGSDPHFSAPDRERPSVSGASPAGQNVRFSRSAGVRHATRAKIDEIRPETRDYGVQIARGMPFALMRRKDLKHESLQSPRQPNKAEFIEMPGLRLRIDQAERLLESRTRATAA